METVGMGSKLGFCGLRSMWAGTGGGGMRVWGREGTCFAGDDRVRVRATNALAPLLILLRTRRDLDGDNSAVGAVSVIVGRELPLLGAKELLLGVHLSPGTQFTRPKSILSRGCMC